jgi:hypothetical protein
MTRERTRKLLRLAEHEGATQPRARLRAYGGSTAVGWHRACPAQAMDMPSADADVPRWYAFGRAVAAGTAAEPDQTRLHTVLAGNERAVDAYLAGRQEEQMPGVPAST